LPTRPVRPILVALSGDLQRPGDRSVAGLFSTALALRYLARELFRYSITQRVGEHQHVLVAFVIGGDVSIPILLQSANHLAGCEVKMLLQHLFHVLLGPVGIGTTQEGGDIREGSLF